MTSADAFSVLSYERDGDGQVATITLRRPKSANALNAQLIDELDGALDLAEADDDVRVVVLAGEGKHFCAGHDLKELFEGTEPWAAMRATPEGKLHHEQVMYWDRCLRLHDFAKPTIAAVQGACSAAGLMLACMCDLIVAADDARFSNPVLRMSGAGVELLVEPWELGARKAKEFLLCAETFDADEAERLGLVNQVVPRAELEAAAANMAAKVALVPPVTAQAVKASINATTDRMGQRDSWRHHFMVHQFVSNTDTALGLAAERAEGGMARVRARSRPASLSRPTRPSRRDRSRSRACGCWIWAPASPPPSAPACWASRAPRSSRSSNRVGRLHARDRPVRRGPGGGPDRYSLFWAVEGRGRRSVTLDLRKPEGSDLLRRLGAQCDVICENFRPGTLERWGLAPAELDPRLVIVRISAFGQDGPYSQRPGLDRLGIGYGGLLNLTGYPDRPPVRPGVTTSDYLTGVFAAQAALAALYRRDAGSPGSASPPPARAR